MKKGVILIKGLFDYLEEVDRYRNMQKNINKNSGGKNISEEVQIK